MKNKFALLLCLLFLTLMNVASAEKYSKANISFDIPEGWQKITENTDGSYLTLKKGDTTISFYTYKSGPEKNSADFDDTLYRTVPGAESSSRIAPGTEFLSLKSEKVGDHTFLIEKSNLGYSATRAIHTSFVHNGNTHAINLLTPLKNIDPDYEAVYYDILRSIQFK